MHNVGDPFARNDSIFVLAANRTDIVGDDVWKLATINTIADAPSCKGTDPAQLITLQFEGAPWGPPPDLVSVGAPVRAFLHYIYGLFEVDGLVYLGRERSGSGVTGGTYAPNLVGPLRPVTAPTFTYWDGFGNATNVATEVEGIRIVLHTSAPRAGGVLQDSLVSDVHPRN